MKISSNLSEFGQTEAVIELPEGSTLKSLLDKYRISKEKDDTKIIVNGKSCHEIEYILKDADVVEIFPSNGTC